jgi:T-complex protein 1 subunit gamma
MQLPLAANCPHPPTHTLTHSYARVEKIPGGEVEECRVLDGIMINKDVTHPKMAREIRNPRIVLLDCPLEYKKGESQTNVEVSDESHWARLLEIEEEQVKALCDDIIRVKPDLVLTEKGVSGMGGAGGCCGWEAVMPCV